MLQLAEQVMLLNQSNPADPTLALVQVMKQQLAALNQQAQAHAGQPMAAQYHVQAQFVAQQVSLPCCLSA